MGDKNYRIAVGALAIVFFLIHAAVSFWMLELIVRRLQTRVR